MIINQSLLIVIPLVTLARLAEIGYGEVNARRLLADEGKEFSPWQRLPVFLMYALWLFLLADRTPPEMPPDGFLMGLFFLSQVARWWAIYHLGEYWTTRIIVVPGARRITSGPYRFFSHPIYGVLVFEVLLLSFAFRQYGLGCLFTGITAGWVFWRMRAESRALQMMK